MKKQIFSGFSIAVTLALSAAACGKSSTNSSVPAPGPVAAPMPMAPGPMMPGPGIAPMPVNPAAQCVGPSFDAGVFWYGISGANQTIIYRYVFTAPQTNVIAGKFINVTKSGYQTNYPVQNYNYQPMSNMGYYSLWNSNYGTLPTAWPQQQATGPQIAIRVSPTAAPGAADLPNVLILNQGNGGVGQAQFPQSGYLVIDYSVPSLYGSQIYYGLNFMLCQ